MMKKLSIFLEESIILLFVSFEDVVYTINFNKSSYLSQHCGIDNWNPQIEEMKILKRGDGRGDASDMLHATPI